MRKVAAPSWSMAIRTMRPDLQSGVVLEQMMLTNAEADTLERDFVEGRLSEEGLKNACIEKLNLC